MEACETIERAPGEACEHAEPVGLSVILHGVERAVPHGLNRADSNAWLAAPLAGAPLYQRMLEALDGLRPVSIRVLDSGPQARSLACLMSGHSAVVPRAELMPAAELTDCVAEHAVLLPAGMLICGSEGLGHRLVAALKSPGHRVLMRLSETFGPREELLAAGPPPYLPCAELLGSTDFAEALVIAKRAADTPILCGSIRGHRFDDSTHLFELARAALTRRLFESVGELRDGLLVGAGVTISKKAKVDGAAAIGKDSYVAPGVVLCEGTLVGECCYIGEGALVSDSLVLDGARVAAGEVVLSSVRGPNGNIEV